MLAHSLVFTSTRVSRHLLWLMVASLMVPLFFVAIPPLVQREQTVAIAQDQPTARTSPALAAPAAPMPPIAQTLPPGLTPVLNATLAADSGADYAIVPASLTDGLRANNPAQQFATTFGADGVRVAPTNGPAFSLGATAIGTMNGSIAITPAQPAMASGRVEYRHDGLTEWYVNGPRGLEQGFTLATPPSGAGAFTIALAVTGATPAPGSEGALLIGDVRYSDLTVIDATGLTLPAHLDLAAGTIRIAVDATGATWPVTVDPTLTQATLTPQTPAGNTASAFGSSIALTAANGTTTVVVGTPSELIGTQDEQGAAYVFTGNGTTYTQQARLVASDGLRQHRFGESVAVTVSGGTTTVVVGAPNNNKAYVFTSSGGAYTEQARLTAPDPTNNFGLGRSVGAATNSGTTIIAVGADLHTVGAKVGVGSVYMYAGSGASYPQQVELNDPNGNSQERFGVSLALVSNGSTNTLAVGAEGYALNNSFNNQGAVLVFTGSGTTYNSVTLTAADGALNDNLGKTVALGINGGITTVVAGGAGERAYRSQDGAVYVFTGSGTTYTQMKLTDAGGVPFDEFGVSVAVGYGSPIGPTLIAVGAPQKSGNSRNPADGVFLFACANGTCTQSSLPYANGTINDNYGSSVAMLTAANGDMTVIAYAPQNTGRAVISFANEAPSLSSITPILGNGAQTIASPAGTFTGTPFHLAAGVVNNLGLPLPATGITFTINAKGTVGGRFTASDPNSTTLHVTTHDGTGGTTAGQTDKINIFPSSTSGTFTVTALADGTTFSTTYTLTIIPSAPKPTINPVIPLRASSAETNAVGRDAVRGQAAGLSPAMVLIDPNQTYEITVSGSGFLSQAKGTIAFLQIPNQTAIQIDTVYSNANTLLVYVVGGLGVFNGLTKDTTAQIYVFTPESKAGAGDGGFSNPVPLQLVMPRPAPAGSKLVPSGVTNYLAPSGSLIVPSLVQVVDANGNPIAGTATGFASDSVGINGGELVGNSGGTLISDKGAGVISNDGGTIVSHDGGSLVGQDGSSVISNDGGTIVSHDGGSIAPTSTGAVRRTDATHPATGNYIASTDKNSIIMAPPVLSNGIPGTYTLTLSVDGIATPITYTITNLNPNDGHPTTITSLSRTTAFTGDPAFTLTVTGTGFINSSVISYGGVQLATTFISATQVSATIPATLLKYSGALAVTVINPDPYGGASLPATFTVGPHVDALPPGKTPGGTSGGPNPLPSSRVTGPSTGNPPPAPLPPSR